MNTQQKFQVGDLVWCMFSVFDRTSVSCKQNIYNPHERYIGIIVNAEECWGELQNNSDLTLEMWYKIYITDNLEFNQFIWCAEEELLMIQ